jgi:hypothetical protein
MRAAVRPEHGRCPGLRDGGQARDGPRWSPGAPRVAGLPRAPHGATVRRPRDETDQVRRAERRSDDEDIEGSGGGTGGGCRPVRDSGCRLRLEDQEDRDTEGRSGRGREAALASDGPDAPHDGQRIPAGGSSRWPASYVSTQVVPDRERGGPRRPTAMGDEPVSRVGIGEGIPRVGLRRRATDPCQCAEVVSQDTERVGTLHGRAYDHSCRFVEDRFVAEPFVAHAITHHRDPGRTLSFVVTIEVRRRWFEGVDQLHPAPPCTSPTYRRRAQ